MSARVCVCAALSVVSWLLPTLSPSETKQRGLSVLLGLGSPYVLLSTSYEVWFLVCLATVLALWLPMQRIAASSSVPHAAAPAAVAGAADADAEATVTRTASRPKRVGRSRSRSRERVTILSSTAAVSAASVAAGIVVGTPRRGRSASRSSADVADTSAVGGAVHGASGAARATHDDSSIETAGAALFVS